MANETVTEEQRILDIKVKYKDAIQSIASYKKKIDELKAAEADLKARKTNKPECVLGRLYTAFPFG